MPLLLPAPTQIPAGLTGQPTFGVNPYSPGNTFLGQSFQQNTQQLLEARAQKQQALFQQAQFASQQNTLSNTLGLTLPSDPTGWTPEQAASQTDNALAKLSTVNPELAASLAAKRTGGETEGGSFLGDLMHAAGDLLHPALSLGGKALEYLGRTAHIVPNLAFDAVDGGAFDPAHDLGGALTGNINHNWNSVFQEAGWTGGGFSGFLRASLGLAGDIITDPLTYIPAGAGLKIGEQAAVASRDVATRLPEVLDIARRAEEMKGLSDEAIVGKLADMWDSVFPKAQKAGAAAGLHNTDLDARVAAALNAATGTEMHDAYSQMFALGQTVGDRILGRGFKAALAQDVFLPVGGDAVEQVTSKSIRDFMNQVVKDGNFTRKAMFAKGADTPWEMGRAFSSIVGGARFKYAIPFTQMRYIGPAIPLGAMEKYLPARGLTMFTRFMAGQSGMTNMLDLVHTGAPDAIKGLQDWQRLGFRDFQKLHPDLAASVTGRFPGMSSAFYTGSDVVGGITSHLSSESKMARKGLASFQAHRDAISANSAANNFVQAAVKRALGDEAGDQFLKKLELQGISAKAGKNTADEDFLTLQMKFRDYFPLAGEDAIDTSSPDAIELFMHKRYPEMGRLEQKAADGGFTLGDQHQLDELHAIMDDAKQTAATMHSDHNAADFINLQKIHQAMLEEASKHDLPLGNVMYRFDEAVTGIPTKQLDLWRDQAGLNHALAYTKNEDGEEGVFFMHKVDYDGTSWNEALTRNPSDSHIIHTDHGSGILVSTKRLHPDDIKVGIKGQDFYELDATGNASVLVNDEMTDVASVRKAIKQQSDAAEAQAEAMKHSTATPDSGPRDLVRATRAEETVAGAEKGAWDQPLDSEEKLARESRALTDELQRYRPDAAGSYTKLEDGSVEATIWDPSNIIRLDDEQPWLQAYQGFAHRTLNQRWGDWLQGNLRNQGEQALLAVPQMRAQLARETAHMTATQASQFVKTRMVEYIVDESHLEGDAAAAVRERVVKSMEDLPDFVWETNPLVEHAKYVNDLAQGIRATELGKAGQRMNRLSAFAPSSFPRPPKGPLYERTIDPGVMAALQKNDKDLVDAVLAMHKSGAKFFGQRAKYYSTIADNMGTFSMLVNKMEEQGYPIGREGEAWVRYGQREKAVREAFDHAEGVIGRRNAELEDEASRLDGMREGAAQTISGGNPGLGAMELGDGIGDLPTERFVPEGAEAPPPVPGEEFVLHSTTRAALPGVQAEGLKLKRGTWLGTEGADEAVWGSTDAATLPPGEVVLRTVKEPGQWSGRAGYDTSWVAGNNPVPPGKLEFLAEDGTWHPLSDLGTGEVSMDQARTMFDERVAAGQVYYNSKTGSVLLKDGSDFVKQGGGRKVRGMPDIQSEAEELKAKLEDINHHREVLDRGASVPLEDRTGFGLKVHEAGAPRRVAVKAHSKSEREVIKAVRQVDEAQAEMERAMNSVNKLVAEGKGLKARMSPALVPLKQAGGLEGLTPMRIPGMEGYAMPSYIAEEWHRIYDVAGPGHLQQEWRKYVLGPWKRWATYRNPGFHVRNFFGAWFNNFLGGVGVDHYGFSYHVNNGKFAETAVDSRYFDRFQLGSVFGDSTKGELTYGQVNRFLAHHGIGEGNVMSVAGAADTYNLADAAVSELTKVRGRAGTAAHKLDSHLRNVGSYVEDFHRSAAWARGMEAVGGDPMGARAFVMMRHGDYADLTKTEDYIKDLVPFYKWMRTNIPYQIRMLAENPAKLTAVDKVKGWAYDTQGIDRANAELQMPEWMKETMSLPIPSWVPVFGSKGPDAIKYAMFDLPYNDLYSGLNDYMSSALPMVRNVLESWGLHKQTFTGRDLTGRMVPLSGAFNIPGVRDVLGAMPFAHKSATGEVFISDQVENVLTGFPIFSKFRNFLESDPARVSQRYGGLLSSIAGIGVRGSDFTQAELAFYNDEVAPALQALRDQGVVFPTTDDFAHASQAVVSSVTPSGLPLPQSVASTGVLAQP